MIIFPWDQHVFLMPELIPRSDPIPYNFPSANILFVPVICSIFI